MMWMLKYLKREIVRKTIVQLLMHRNKPIVLKNSLKIPKGGNQNR